MSLRLIYYVGIASLAMVACTIEKGSSASTSDSTKSPMTAKLVAAEVDLPICDSENHGSLYYVVNLDAFQVCGNAGYESIDLTGPTGLDGTNCTGDSIADGIVIRCGGIVMDTLPNALDGSLGLQGKDGVDCEGVNSINGLQIICGDQVYSIGEQVGGVNGENGTDGVSCSAVSISVGIAITCGTHVDTLFHASNGTDGIQGQTGNPGVVGAQGTAGVSYTASQESTGIIIYRDGISFDTIPFVSAGLDGTDGVSVDWLGTLNYRPLTPSFNQAFYWETAGVSCIFDNSGKWVNLTKNGDSDGDCSKGGVFYSPMWPAASSYAFPWVQIGNQIWQAKNYVYRDGTKPSNSYCYGDVASGCTDLTGYWYVHSFAILTNGSEVVCPIGWHLPSKAEWQTLFDYVDSMNGGSTNDAALSLKATTGWTNSSFAGTDAYGFDARANGYQIEITGAMTWVGAGASSVFWTRDIDESFVIFGASAAPMFSAQAAQEVKANVRCVMD